MTMNGDNYSFVYDKTAGIPAVMEEVTPDGSFFYIREPGGELIARVDEDENIRYYHFDELGSTRMLTDGSGTVTDRYVYDAWGNTLSHTGGTDQPYQYVGRLGYYTHHQDPEFGLMQLGVRFYDAQVGRFTQRDSVDEGTNLYEYVEGGPLSWVDPNGLSKCRTLRPGNDPAWDIVKKALEQGKSHDDIVDELMKKRGFSKQRADEFANQAEKCYGERNKQKRKSKSPRKMTPCPVPVRAPEIDPKPITIGVIITGIVIFFRECFKAWQQAGCPI